MVSEGYIKFNIDFLQDNPPDNLLISEINKIRTKLYDLKMIGEYPDGIGFGNLSVNFNEGFIITASKTGGIRILKNDHYSIVTDYNISDNYISCRGKMKASSESLTHAAAYQANDEIKSVIHIHNHELWMGYKDILPTTSDSAEFGTIEIAREIGKLIISGARTIIMGGHQEGIICCGNNPIEAYNNIMKLI